MAALGNFDAYSANYAGWMKFNWNIYLSTVDWLACAFVKTGDTRVIDGETKDVGILYYIGKKSAIPGEPSYTYTYTNGTGPGYMPESLVNMPAVSAYSERNGYGYVATGTGAIMCGSDTADYTYATQADFENAIDNDEIQAIKPTVYFDVYLDGSDMPTINVNWTAPEELSPVSLQPEIWFATEDLSPDPEAPEVITRDGIKYPDVSVWNVVSAGSYGYGGSMSTTYLSIMNAIEPKMSFPKAAFKIFHWGFDGKPAYVRLYMRMNNGEDIGELQRTQITIDGSGSNTEIANSGNDAPYNTVVRFHTGEPDYVLPDDDDDYPGGTNIDDDGPGRYDPDNPPPIPDFQQDEGIGFDGNAVLTTTYVCSSGDLVNVGQKLWSQAYFNVLKVQSNPIENIVSIKAFPMAIPGGSSETIKVGDIDFGVTANKHSSLYVFTVGSVKYTGYYTAYDIAHPGSGNRYLDFAPYTKVKLNLPYIGLIELDPNEIYGSTISVKYIIDLVTGQCMAIITLDAIPFLTVTGQMGFDIPLTATDRVQTELRVASAAITAVGGAAGHILAGDVGGGVLAGATGAMNIMGADYTSQRTASPSPACASYANHMVYLLIDRPQTSGQSSGFKHLHGKPCHKYSKLSNLSGFVAVDRRADIKVGMTSEENKLLEQLLTEGVYI